MQYIKVVRKHDHSDESIVLYRQCKWLASVCKTVLRQTMYWTDDSFDQREDLEGKTERSARDHFLYYSGVMSNLDDLLSAKVRRADQAPFAKRCTQPA
jgi:hypothetical protein